MEDLCHPVPYLRDTVVVPDPMAKVGVVPLVVQRLLLHLSEVAERAVGRKVDRDQREVADSRVGEVLNMVPSENEEEAKIAVEHVVRWVGEQVADTP